MKAFTHILCGLLPVLLMLSDCRALKLKLNSAEDVCIYFPDGAVLRKPGTCTDTIECQDGRSLPHTVKCTGDKIVKLDKMTCAADSAKAPDKYCTPTCLKSSPKFIQSVNNCNGWAECKQGMVTHTGSCPPGQIFDQMQQRCIYENDSECYRPFDICHVAQINQMFWDKTNCQRYYYCNAKHELITAKCSVGNYYEASSGACIKKTQVNCYQHPVPDEGCGTKKRAILDHFIGDQASCRGYFYCKDKGRSADGNYIVDNDPNWGQCKMGEFFDEKLQYCRDMNYVKCNEDRCDSITSGKVLAENPGCQHYLECQDGYTIGEIQCPDNKYFDPVQQSCISAPVSYPICN